MNMIGYSLYDRLRSRIELIFWYVFLMFGDVVGKISWGIVRIIERLDF